MSGESVAERDAAIWCGACGIPYAPGTPYCGNCRQALGAGKEDGGMEGENPVAPAPRTDSAAGTSSATFLLAQPAQSDRFVGDAEPGRQPVRPSNGLGRRVARRPQPLTEDEIEARAAAIVAQAQAEELFGVDASPQADAPPDPALAAAHLTHLEFLPPLRDRDRQWLGAGLVCCAVLVIFTIFFVRYLAG